MDSRNNSCTLIMLQPDTDMHPVVDTASVLPSQPEDKHYDELQIPAAAEVNPPSQQHAALSESFYASFALSELALVVRVL